MNYPSFDLAIRQNIATPTPLVQINHPLASKQGIRWYVKRDDLTHPIISGNKWRKLKFNLISARANGSEVLLTVGGPYSNHIAAVAAAGKLFGFKTIGIIRGHEGMDTPTLVRARDDGMRIEFINRDFYRQRDTEPFIQFFHDKFGDFFYLPEGGTNALALRGCAELIDEVECQLPGESKIYCAAVGSGGTLAGIIRAMRRDDAAHGVAVVNDLRLPERIKTLCSDCEKKWNLDFSFVFGGYGKTTPELVEFARNWQAANAIPLDYVYTAKLFFAIENDLSHQRFARGSTIVAIHTGGLQGNSGFGN